MAKSKSESLKKASYDVFRFQISPRSNFQYELFGQEFTADQLKARKNEFFHEAMLNIRVFLSAHGNTLHHKIYFDKEHFTGLKIGPERTLHIEDKDFNQIDVEAVMAVQVVINNDPKVQKIAISRNRTAFESSFVVANILADNFNRALEKYNLEISINPILEKQSFWKLIKSYEHRITAIKFEIVRPNISEISKSLSDHLKGLVTLTGSNRTDIELKAAPGRVLENVNEDNQPLVDIANYATEGGASDIKIKVKGMKKTIRTNSTIESFQIEEVEINGDIAVVQTMYNQILNH